ncbi:MAG: SCO family protein [Candidatus Omnitrophica bacterium]|nr:SCO family protein [Candidatus Omnitrophota bacterium]
MATFLAPVQHYHKNSNQTDILKSALLSASENVLPEFALTDQNGRAISRDNLLGKIWVANFIFTRCNVSCPKMTAQMAGLQEAFRNDPHIRLVSFSVDPAYDTSAVLNDFARSYRAEPEQWLFLTGPKDTVFNLARGYFLLSAGHVSEEDRKAGAEEILHSERFVLVNPEGRIEDYFDGFDAASVEALKSRMIQLKQSRFPL